MQYRNESYAEGVFDTFWFEKNLQGDVVAIYNNAGVKLASYIYDAWGNFTVTYTNGGATTAAQYNPFTYRSYYYDDDLGLYYLNSRYYDSHTGRFINSDGFLSNHLLGYNMFAYCYNNPVNMIDLFGEIPKWLNGVFNVISGGFQMVAGAALGITVGWTGFGTVVSGFLMVNGAATTTQGIGQIVNDLTDSSIMREDNIIKTGVQGIGQFVGGDRGAQIAGLIYDLSVVTANIYAGKVILQQAGKLPIRVNINNVVNNPLDEFVTIGPADGVISQYYNTIPQMGYGKIYATYLENGFYQLANGQHRVAALRMLGVKFIKIYLIK